ncbi:MAG: FHA domain-containing protein, partial [Candidatus Obscuribacterales bacterium]|nr:FHA domain-containing protein [Candidatus Obscuribacterales bacterium]
MFKSADIDAPRVTSIDNIAADAIDDAATGRMTLAGGAVVAGEVTGSGLVKETAQQVSRDLSPPVHGNIEIASGSSLHPETTEVGARPNSVEAQSAKPEASPEISNPVEALRTVVEGNADPTFNLGDPVLVDKQPGLLVGVDTRTGEPIVEFPDRAYHAIQIRPVDDLSKYQPITIQGHQYHRNEYGNVYSIHDFGEGPRLVPVPKYQIVSGKSITHAPVDSPVVKPPADIARDPFEQPRNRATSLDRPVIEPPEIPRGSGHKDLGGAAYHPTGIYDGAFLTVNGYPITHTPRYDGEPVALGRQSLGLDFEGNKFVSRQHADIQWDAKQQMYYLEERSSNGTFLKRSGESEFQFLPAGKDNPYRVYIGPDDTVRLGSLEGPEVKLNVPDSGLNSQLKPNVGPSGDVDVRIFFDGKPLSANANGEMLIGRVHQSVGVEGLSDILDHRVSSNHAKLRWDETEGKWEFTDLTRSGSDYQHGQTVMARQGGNGTFIKRENGKVEFLQGQSTYLGPNDSVHLGSPDGPELKFITNQGQRLPDGRVEVPRKNFDMAVKRPDGTTEITTFLGFRRLEDPSGRVIQTLDPDGVRRGFVYGPDGKLQKVKFDDDSIIERTADDAWVRTGPDGRKETFWNGDIEVEPDGAVKFRDTGEPPSFTIERVDGTREIVHPNGRVEYKNVDFMTELSYMNRIKNSFPDEAQQVRYKNMMNAFEQRAREAGLSQQEKALTFHHVRRLFQAEYGAFLTAPERSRLAEQIMFMAGNPAKICQGANSTCNVSTVEHRLFARQPSEAARLISDVVITGKYVTADGSKVDLGRIPGVLRPDPESLMLARQFSPDGSDIKIDGKRTYAGQIFETTAVNLRWADSPQYKIKPGDIIVYEKVTGPVTGTGTEELVRYSVGPLGNLNREVVKNSPHIGIDDLESIYNRIAGTR